MIEKKLRMKLARLLKLYKQVNTNLGVLEAETEEIIPGTEVFITNQETGELEPAQDGIYKDETNQVEYVVEAGIIKEINKIETTELNNQEEGSDNGEDKNNGSDNGSGNGSDNGAGDTGKMEDETKTDENEAKIAELMAEIETKNAEIETKDAKIAELEQQLNEYKEKEGKVSAEPAEQKDEFSADHKLTPLEKKLKLAEQLRNR